MAYHGSNNLYKTRRGAMIGGVCAGFSEYFTIDVSLIRVIAILLIIGFGTGLIIYIALWMILPER